ncbi:MAG: hypothetical protein AABX52_03915 [Nanoarchaeota archaeon]
MIETDVEVKKWGDSLAVIIPRQLAEEEHIGVRDRIHLRIDKETDLSDIFGIAKGITKNTQELKDEAKKGWE